MWTICDYPALDLISGLCMHGYKACLVCGPATNSRSAKTGNKLDSNQKVKGKKIIFIGGRRWTHCHHPYQTNLSFNGKPETREPHVRMSGEQTLRCAYDREDYLSEGGREGGDHDLVHVHGVKHRSCLDALPYWKVSH
jgi:hypothetical protein